MTTEYCTFHHVVLYLPTSGLKSKTTTLISILFAISLALSVSLALFIHLL